MSNHYNHSVNKQKQCNQPNRSIYTLLILLSLVLNKYMSGSSTTSIVSASHILKIFGEGGGDFTTPSPPPSRTLFPNGRPILRLLIWFSLVEAHAHRCLVECGPDGGQFLIVKESSEPPLCEGVGLVYGGLLNPLTLRPLLSQRLLLLLGVLPGGERDSSPYYTMHFPYDALAIKVTQHAA